MYENYVPDQKAAVTAFAPPPPPVPPHEDQRFHQPHPSSSTVHSQASSSKHPAPTPPSHTRAPHAHQDSISSANSNIQTPPPAPSPSIGPAPMAQPPHQSRRLVLVSPLLPFTQVNVASSHIRTNERFQEVISFSIQVKVSLPKESDPQGVGGTARWAVEKMYSDVLGLDAKVKAKHNRLQSRKLAQLPDKSLFKDHAPTKVDQRKASLAPCSPAVLTKYLQSLVSTPLKDKSDICEFFNTNVAQPVQATPNSGLMEGHLTKKGRTLGGWQTRYYVLMGPNLEYFEQKGGKYIGQIIVTGASIGRQQPRKEDTGNDDSYRHAFLIRTAKIADQVESDHILCAESDEERDQWVRALTCWVQGRFVSTDPSVINPDQRAASQKRKMSRDELQRPTIAQAPQGYDRKMFAPGVADDLSDGSDLEPPNRNRHQRDHSLGSSSINSNPYDEQPRRRPVQQDSVPPSESTSSNMENLAQQIARESRMRSNSALGQYEDQKAARPPRAHNRLASQSSADELNRERPVTPDHARKQQQPDRDTKLAGKISGPMNGAPIPSGYNLKPKVDKAEERQKKTRSTFWGGFTNRTDKREAPQPIMQAVAQPVANRPVFGVPLAEAVAVARVREGLELPAVVFRCVEYLEQKSAEKEEGIYRLSGSSNVIRALKDKFNAEGDFNICQSPEYYDPHAVAGLLKTFLRDLPQHILTRELHSDFLQVIDLRQRKDKVNELGRLVAQLPLPNYTLLRFLTAHLIHIVQNEKINKMTLRNVGIVFSPTLAMPAPLFSLLLSEFEFIFNCDDSGEAAPIRVEEEEQPKVISHMERAVERRLHADGMVDRRKSRNSIMYSQTGADQLMEGMINKLEEAEESDDNDVTEDEPNHHETDSEEETVEARGHLHPPHNNREASPQRLQIHVSHDGRSPSPIGSPRSPRTPGFGLPSSPRPGASFSTSLMTK
ncbi:RhoGAP-domain-containing protein [Atractiella rhizophila]|nr:RhoGAP-domain-containing protein [Atractiella rhizophila]